MSIEKAETNAATILPIMERDYKARLAAAIDLIRDYYWCYSRTEGRRIDAKAEKFLDANGGRESPVSEEPKHG